MWAEVTGSASLALLALAILLKVMRMPPRSGPDGVDLPDQSQPEKPE